MAPTVRIAVLLLLSALPVSAGRVELISELPARRVSDTAGGGSGASSLSANGRFLVFLSNAPNLVAGQIDTNLRTDVFLHDRVAGTTTLVSRTEDSPVTAADEGADSPVISADGRWIAYVQSGNGRVGAEARFGQVLLYDRLTETTTLVSRSGTGPGDGHSSAPALSEDGRYLAYVSFAKNLVDGLIDTNGYPDVFLYDRVARKTTLVSRTASSPAQAALGFSGLSRPSLSADGRYVAFESGANDLVAGQGAPNVNVFLFDRVTGRNTMVSHRHGSRTAGGNHASDGPRISANGEYVVYASWATDLVAGQADAGRTGPTADVFLFHRPSGTTTLVSHASGSRVRTGNNDSSDPFVSADGSWVVFGSEASNLVGGQQEVGVATSDVFLFERATGRVTLASRSAVSSSTAGDEASFPAGLSADGGLVLFQSRAANLASPAEDTLDYDVFLHDRRSRKTTLVSYAGAAGNLAGNGHSVDARISADGNWIAFGSTSTNLARRTKDFNESPDVFLYGRTTGVHMLVSRRDPALPGRTPLADSDAGSTSRDGRFVTFTSRASDLVPGQRDTNGEDDVFLRDRALGTTVLVSRSAASPLQAGNGRSLSSGISADGNFVLFTSRASDLIAGGTDANQDYDLFLYDRAAGTVTLVSRSASSPLTAANGLSAFGDLSADGSVVAFSSTAPDLAAGQAEADPDHPTADIFLYRRGSGAVTLVSHAFGSATAANESSFFGSMTSDARFVVFESLARDLGPAPPPGLGDFHGNLYLFDQSTGAITLVTRTAGVPPVPAGGFSFRGRPSEDGRFVVFSSGAPNLVPGQNDHEFFSEDVFLFDSVTGEMKLLSHAAGSPTEAVGATGRLALSADGRYIVFASEAPNLVTGQDDEGSGPDVFVFDRVAGTTELVSRAHGTGASGGGESQAPVISPNGRYIAFHSSSSRLLPEPVRPSGGNVYLYDQTTRTTSLVSPAAGTTDQPDSASASWPAAVTDHGLVLFTSDASNLVPGDYNFTRESPRPFRDVFLYVP